MNANEKLRENMTIRAMVGSDEIYLQKEKVKH